MKPSLHYNFFLKKGQGHLLAESWHVFGREPQVQVEAQIMSEHADEHLVE
jgi:hypothetical protein